MKTSNYELDNEVFKVCIYCVLFRFIWPPLQQAFEISLEIDKAKSCANIYADLEPDKGIPHICVAYDNGTYRSLWILMIRKKWGRVTAAQQKWLDTLNKKGSLAVVCRTSEEAKSIIWDYVDFTETYEAA